MRTHILLLLSLAALIHGKCGNFKDCSTCADGYEGLIKCQWCAGDNACHNSLQTDCKALNLITHSFDCPKAVPNGFEYSDDFSRKYILPAIAATNVDGKDIQTCLSNNFKNISLINQYTVKCDSDGDNCSSYIAVDHTDKAIIIAFRGSKGVMQLLLEGTDFLFNDLKSFPITGGKVDKYFYDGFYDLWNVGMESDLHTVIVQNPTYQLWSVGHSLGGSMAAMASAYCVKKNYFATDDVRLVTFGEPRTGDIEFAEGHDKMVKYTYRIIHNHDIIPHLPPRVFDNLFDSPFHHRYEVWYQNNMTAGAPYQICTRADDHACSNSVSDTTAADHVVYFNENLENFAKAGCK
uniref:Lipase_3 domain-containing protein n=1 Tax=Parastrongyloides trichosuri TaxID=131310 RepID=A0A0N4Z488_PARTI